MCVTRVEERKPLKDVGALEKYIFFSANSKHKDKEEYHLVFMPNESLDFIQLFRLSKI